MATIESVNVALTARTARLERDLRRAQRSWRFYTRTVNRQLAGAARAAGRIGAVLGAGLALSTREFVNFERQLQKITALVGVSEEALSGMAGAIREIGSDTGQGPRELLDALFDITSAGLRGQAALDVLQSSARASAIGLGEQRVVANLTVSALNAYGEAQLSATQATDQLTAAIRLGILQPETLATAMGRVLPISSAMGISFGEVAGALSAMSRTGTTAEEGVTALRSVMTAFLKPAATAEQAVAAIGLNFDDLRQSIRDRGLFETLVQLRELLGGTNQDLVSVFPNVRALAGLFDLLGPGLETNRMVIQETVNAVGLLDDAFGGVAESASRQLLRALSDIRFAFFEFTQNLIPAIIPAVNAFRESLSSIDAAALGRSLSGVAESFARFTVAIIDHRQFLAGLIKAYLTFRVAALGAAFGTAVLAAIKGIRALTAAVRTAGITALLASGATAAIPLAIGAAAAAAIAYWRPLAGLFSNIADRIAIRFQQLVVTFRTDGLRIRLAWDHVLTFMLQAFERLVERIVNFFGTTLPELLNNIPGVNLEVRTPRAFDFGGTEAQQQREQTQAQIAALNRVYQQLKTTGDAIQLLPPELRQEFGSVTQNIGDFFRGTIDDLLSIFDSETVADLVPPSTPGSLLANLGTAPQPGTVPDEETEETRNIGADLVQAFNGGLRSAITSGDTSAIGSAVASAVTNTIAGELADAITDPIKQVFSSAFENVDISDSLSQLFRKGFDLIGDIFGSLGGLFGGIFHDGGIVPGRRGQTVPILAEAGERVLTREQQRDFGPGFGMGSVTINNNLTGDVDAATVRAMQRNARQQADILFQEFQRRRIALA